MTLHPLTSKGGAFVLKLGSVFKSATQKGGAFLMGVRVRYLHKKTNPGLGLVFGASDLTRTGDLLITSEMHYRLCYTSKPQYYSLNFYFCQPINKRNQPDTFGILFLESANFSASWAAWVRTCSLSPSKRKQIASAPLLSA